MHLGTHLTNLLKVSESIFVRRAAGNSLLKIASTMTYAQRNELTVELFNGLEIGDPQTDTQQKDGRSLRTWQEDGYSVTLLFDAQGLCLGVEDERY